MNKGFLKYINKSIHFVPQILTEHLHVCKYDSRHCKNNKGSDKSKPHALIVHCCPHKVPTDLVA